MSKESSMSSELPERVKFLLGIIDLSSYLEGITRIQKLVFLAPNYAKELERREFYRDWTPNKYGPYSTSLAADLNYVIKGGIVKGYPVKNEYNYAVTRYAVTDDSKKLLQPFLASNKNIFSKLKPMLDKYAHAPLMSLLHDVYYQFPKYIVQSTIKGKVALQDSLLSEDYDFPAE